MPPSPVDYPARVAQTPKTTDAEYTVFDGSLQEYLGTCDSVYFELYDKSDLALPSNAYAQYFEQCAPAECTYVEVRKPGFAELLTLTLGLLGGLITIIKAAAGVIGKRLVPEQPGTKPDPRGDNA